MDNDELKEYIDDVESRIIKCVDMLSDKVSEVRKLQINCPLTKRIIEIEKITAQIKGKQFWNTIMASLFLTMTIALGSLHIGELQKIQSGDVLEQVRKLEKKIDEEIYRERKEDEIEWRERKGFKILP